MASSNPTNLSEIVIQAQTGLDHGRNTKQTRPSKIVFIRVFLGLLRRIRSGPTRLFRRAQPEAEVYHRIMDDLEDEEENGPQGWWAKVLVVWDAVLFFGLVAALVIMVTVEGVKHHRLVSLQLWQWVMVLVLGLSVVRFVTFMVFTFVKWRWRVHRYVVYILEEIKWLVDMTLWFGLVLAAWCLWLRPRLLEQGKGNVVSRVAIHQTTMLLIALVMGSFLWTLKNALYLKLKADLHYDQLFDRIKNTVIGFHGIQTIYNEGVWKFLTSPKNMLKGTSHIAKGKNIWIELCGMKKKMVPIWVVSRLAAVYMKQMKKVGLPRKRDVTRDDHKLMAEALQMLSGIIRDHPCSDKLLPEHFDKYGLEGAERDYLFQLFDTREQKEENPKFITTEQFLSWAVKAYKMCWGLERTLRSSEKVFIKLNRIMTTFLLVFVLIIWLLLSRIIDTGQLALLFSPFLAASFIFGDTCKNMFEGLIFTFAMHPFDVGDRVVIDDVQMKVTQLNILTSTFFKYDMGEEVVYPNSILASTKVTNLDITPDQADSLEFTISSSTPLEDITDLELKIKKALDDDISYASQTKVVKKEVAKEEIKMGVYFKYLVSYLATETKALHKSRILTKIMEFNREMEKNIQQASSAIEVGRVDFVIDATVTIEQIDHLKNKMFENYERYKEYSKILMKSLDKKDIEMVVCLRHHISEGTKDFEEVEDLKERVREEIRKWKDGNLQDQGAWSSRRVFEVRSMGRMSKKGGASGDAVTKQAP